MTIPLVFILCCLRSSRLSANSFQYTMEPLISISRITKSLIGNSAGSADANQNHPAAGFHRPDGQLKSFGITGTFEGSIGTDHGFSPDFVYKVYLVRVDYNIGSHLPGQVGARFGSAVLQRCSAHRSVLRTVSRINR